MLSIPRVLRRACLFSTALLACSPPAAAVEPPDPDERLILLLNEYVLSFDTPSVRIDGNRRSARMHMYLSAPDDEGYVGFTMLEEVDCKAGVARYSEAIGRRPDGTRKPVTPEKLGFQPIVKDSWPSVARDHLCALKQGGGVYGVPISVPGEDAAHAAFALLKLGIEAKPAADLVSQWYADWDTAKSVFARNGIAKDKYTQVVTALGPLIPAEAQPPAPIVPQAAAVASKRAGQYVHSEMELVAGLWLKLDGTFYYGLTVGSLDEAARGRWRADGNRITLTQGDPPAQRGDLNVGDWQVTSDGKTLTIVRPDGTLRFERRQPGE